MDQNIEFITNFETNFYQKQCDIIKDKIAEDKS